MLEVIREFRVGRPQIFAGLLLLAFLFQALWVATGRRFSDLEYEYIASGLSSNPGQQLRVTSPFTSFVAALPVRFVAVIRNVLPASLGARLAIPRPWLVRLPFVIFGLWLGGAIWWVARRLFGNAGGYVALALFCFSPAMVMISSNIGPEIILAWSGFGLIYTAIGVAHTVYAPPRKWIPRIVLLGLAIGICITTVLWSFTLVVLASVFMFYLAPGKRREVAIVLCASTAIGLIMLGIFRWLTGMEMGSSAVIALHPTFDLVRNLGFVYADSFDKVQSVGSYLLALLFVFALTVYGSWQRARYFGNTSPLLTAFVVVLLFTLVPATHLWNAALGLSFAFVFIGGVVADLLESRFRRPVAVIFVAILVLKIVPGLSLLRGWVHQNPL